MPEIGLLPFTRVALEVARAVLPPYRTRFSKHQFTQPQLLTILCLMRYEDWTFREAEVRLREHRELRAVLKLSSVPDYTTVYRFLRRLPDDTIENVLGESVRRLRRSSRRGRRQAAVAVDGTGLSPHGVSTYFLRRIEQHNHGKKRYRHFLKWLVVADVDRQIILAQRARQGPWCDTPALPSLVDAASRVTPIGLVLADAEFDSEANHRHIRTTLGAQSVIPTNPRRGIPEGAIRYQMHRAFPQKLYAPRAKVETVFSVVKRKLSAKAPGRTLPTQVRQAMLLGLTFNLYRLRHRRYPRGYQQSWTGTKQMVELHTEHTFRYYPRPMRIEELFSRKRMVLLDGREVPALSLEDELVLTYLGMKGEDAVALLREKRPGALFNENFAAYLTALPPNTTAPSPS